MLGHPDLILKSTQNLDSTCLRGHNYLFSITISKFSSKYSTAIKRCKLIKRCFLKLGKKSTTYCVQLLRISQHKNLLELNMAGRKPISTLFPIS